MSEQAPNWFKETVKTKVHHRIQASGPYLDGTMMRGDIDGGTVKYPRLGRVDMYEINGAIEKIDVQQGEMDTVTSNFRDFELPVRWRSQDDWDMGPMQQDAFATMVAQGLNRQKDNIKLNALRALANVGVKGETIDSFGGAGQVIDIKMIDELVASIFAAGLDDSSEIYIPVPHLLFTQLNYYEEFNNLDWVGEDNLGFANRKGVQKKYRNGAHIFTMPDEHFETVNGGEDYRLIGWAKMAMGQENQMTGEPNMWRDHGEKGSPYYYKQALRDSAVGIEPKAVKSLIVSKQTEIKRPGS